MNSIEVNRDQNPTNAMARPAHPVLRDDILSRAVDDEFVLYDPISDQVTLINPSAALVLDCCDGEHDQADIVEVVGRTLDVSPDEVEQAVEETLLEFERLQLFEAS